jgi:hypothetical protein
VKDSSSYKLNISPESGFDRVREHNAVILKVAKRNCGRSGSFTGFSKSTPCCSIIITPPVLKTYFSNVNTELINQNQQTIDGLCQIYHCRYKIISATDDFYERFLR